MAPAQGDHTEYIQFARRILRAMAKRIASADPEDLEEMLALRKDLDVAIDEAVIGLVLRSGYSWADISRATGTSRQAAHARWGAKVKAAQAEATIEVSSSSVA